MTHSGGKHHNVGDRGQRYEVRAVGWPKTEESVIGWTPTLEGAERLLSNTCKAPGCTSVTIFDREQDKLVITRYARILR